MTPDYFTPEAIKKFIKTKTPLYPSLVDVYFELAPKHNLRVDYAIYCALSFTNYFRGPTRSNDFGGGEALDVASGIENALVRLEKLKDWLMLPIAEYEGMKSVEEQFLKFIGVIKPAPPKVVPPPSQQVPPPASDASKDSSSTDVPAPAPAPVPAAPAPAPAKSGGGFWAFVGSVAGTLAVVNSLLWIARLFIPGSIISIIEVVIKFVSDLAASHPQTAAVGFVSTMVATHAVALKINPPQKWQRPQKGAV